MHERIRYQPAVWLLLAFVMSGCRGGCNSGYVPETSLQGKELKAILDEGRKIEVAKPEAWPVQFDAVAIDKKTEADATSYRAVLVWRLSGLQAAVRPQLEKMLKDHIPAWELPEREVKQIEMELKFQNKEGDAVGRQSVKLDLDGNEGKLILAELGKKGSPHSIAAEVVGCTVVERGTIPVSVVGDAPLRVQPIKVSKTTTRGKSSYEGRMKWNLHPDRDAAKAALQKILTATKPDGKADVLENAIFEVEYKDKNGAMTRERFTIPLNSAGGDVTLSQLGENGLPAGATVKLVSIALSGSTVDVSGR